MKERNSRFIALLIAFLPLLSLISAAVLMMPGNAPAAEGSPAAASSEASLPIFPIIIGVLLLGTKITAIISNARQHYFGWVYHALELHFVIFLLGLFVVLSTFNQSWDAAGAIKLVITFMLVVANLKLKDIWLGSRVRSDFHVAQHTHADL